MKHFFSLFILFGFLLGSNVPTFAAEPRACTDYLERFGEFIVQRFQATTPDKSCFLSADPFTSLDLIYRGYLATNEGSFMVFNSYSSAESAEATGARVFYFFPRNQTPDVVPNGNQIHFKTATRGIELILSQTKTQIIGMKGGRVKESPKVSPSNNGGVEFSKVQFLYLDAGFQLGGDVTANPNRNSKFIDSKGHTCTVKNSEIFKYASDGEPDFRFTDPQLKVFLKGKCPNLAVGF